MTDKFTPELIESIIKAFRRFDFHVEETGTITFSESEVKSFIEELTASQWKPYKPIHDEVYYTGGHYIKYREGDILSGNPRSLTPDEVPAWKRDKEALKVAIKGLQEPYDFLNSMGDELDEAERQVMEMLRFAIAKIKKLTAANEDMK